MKRLPETTQVYSLMYGRYVRTCNKCGNERPFPEDMPPRGMATLRTFCECQKEEKGQGNG